MEWSGVGDKVREGGGGGMVDVERCFINEKPDMPMSTICYEYSKC